MRDIVLPAENIISIEMQLPNDESHWYPARLPLRIKHIVLPIDQIFASGSGAIIRNVTPATTDAAVKVLQEAIAELTVDCNVRICEELLDRLRLLKSCLLAENYEQAHSARLKFLEQNSTIPRDLSDIAISSTLADSFHEAADRIAHVFEDAWKKYESSVNPRPSIEAPQTPTRIIVGTNGEAELPFKIYLGEEFAPATNVRLNLDETPGLEIIGALPSVNKIGSGEKVKLTLRVTTNLANHERGLMVTLKAQLRFLIPNGSENLSPRQSVIFNVQPPETFKTLDNPFAPYAGGTTVSDPAMFFGRDALLSEVVRAMSSGPLGQCYALYGQKRTGKSSFVAQVVSKLVRPVIPVSISLGTIDRDKLTVSFVREVLQQVRVAIVSELDADGDRKLQNLWPDDRRIRERPLESLRSGLIGGRQLLSRRPGWVGMRYVLVIDEFTYLFEVLRRPGSEAWELINVREFMRQWKALLDAQSFSAIVVGQDTMPYAMRRFANEFSNMTSRRLSYLETEETASLAEKPVLRADGRSRYTGYASDAIYTYTDGHPYFTQIVCDRLIQHANRKRRSDFSENDVEEAIESLIWGRDALDMYRFDCFLSADNTGLVAETFVEGYATLPELEDDGGERVLHLLCRLAELSGPQHRFVAEERLGLGTDGKAILNDLIVREIITEGEGGLKIRVLLFAEYLRRMR